MKYTILLIISLLLIGCNPEPPIEPVTSIMIIPERSEIKLGESVELYCIDQLHRQVVAKWSKRCNAGTLEHDSGTTCIYTTPKTMTGIQEIYAKYGNLKAMAKVKAVNNE